MAVVVGEQPDAMLVARLASYVQHGTPRLSPDVSALVLRALAVPSQAR